jgi:hypothetical protein
MESTPEPTPLQNPEADSTGPASHEVASMPIEIVISPELSKELTESSIRVLKRLVRWDEETQKFILREDAPELVIIPLRSGPIAAAGITDFLHRHGIQYLGLVDDVTIGREIQREFAEYFEQYAKEHNILSDEGEKLYADEVPEPRYWTRPDVQMEFSRWIAREDNISVRPVILRLRQAQHANTRLKGASCVFFVDDCRTEERIVSESIMPRVLDAVYADTSYELQSEIICKNIGWLTTDVIQTTFAQELARLSTQQDKDQLTLFLLEVAKGGPDDDLRHTSEWSIQQIKQYAEDFMKKISAPNLVPAPMQLEESLGRSDEELLDLNRIIREKIAEKVRGSQIEDELKK